MIQDIIIYGAGGFGREMLVMAEQINQEKKQWNILGFVDDSHAAGAIVSDYPVLGGRHFLESSANGTSVLVAIADPAVRRKVVSGITAFHHLRFPAFIHPSANLGDRRRNSMGEGTIVTAGNHMTTGISLGRFVIVNLACTLGHDVTIRDFSTIMPGSNISGYVSIGEGTLIGTGAKVLQHLVIGNNSKIGAGAVVTRNVGDNIVAVGVPARERKGV